MRPFNAQEGEDFSVIKGPIDLVWIAKPAE